MNSEHTARLAHGFCSPDLSSLAPFRLGLVARLFKVKILRTGSESVPPCRGSRGFGPLVVTFAGRLKGAAPVLRCPWASYFGRCMASARHFLGSRNHGLGVRLRNLGTLLFAVVEFQRAAECDCLWHSAGLNSHGARGLVARHCFCRRGLVRFRVWLACWWSVFCLVW